MIYVKPNQCDESAMLAQLGDLVIVARYCFSANATAQKTLPKVTVNSSNKF